MKLTTLDKVSLDDVFAQIAARRRAENPWTPADEARYSARSAMERARQEAWEIANPNAENEENEENET